MGHWVLARSLENETSEIWERVMFNCNAYPTLDTYKKAVAHFENVVPMKSGDMVGLKPIHLRSHHHKYQIITMVGKEVHWGYQYTTRNEYEPESYFCKWLPNGEIHVRAPMYNCVYEVLYSLFGLNFYRKDNKIWVNTHITLQLRDRTSDPKHVNIFKRDTSGHLQLTNPLQRTKMVVDRARANNVRARYASFRKYMAGNIKLRDNGTVSVQEMYDVFGSKNNSDMMPSGWWSVATPPTLEIKEIRNYYQPVDPTERVDDFIELITSDDPVKYYRAFLWLASAVADGMWNSNDRMVTVRKMDKALDEVLFYKHRDEVFKKKTLPYGDTTRDTYGWVFR